MTPVEILGRGSVIPPGTRIVALPSDKEVHVDSTKEGALGSGTIWEFLETGGELPPGVYVIGGVPMRVYAEKEPDKQNP